MRSGSISSPSPSKTTDTVVTSSLVHISIFNEVVLVISVKFTSIGLSGGYQDEPENTFIGFYERTYHE